MKYELNISRDGQHYARVKFPDYYKTDALIRAQEFKRRWIRPEENGIDLLDYGSLAKWKFTLHESKETSWETIEI